MRLFSILYLIRTLIFFFFFNDTATTEIYTLSLHDALPIWMGSTSPSRLNSRTNGPAECTSARTEGNCRRDRKSTRLNSSHGYISYAVFCLKKKKTNEREAGPRHTLISGASYRTCCAAVTPN